MKIDMTRKQWRDAFREHSKLVDRQADKVAESFGMEFREEEEGLPDRVGWDGGLVIHPAATRYARCRPGEELNIYREAAARYNAVSRFLELQDIGCHTLNRYLDKERLMLQEEQEIPE